MSGAAGRLWAITDPGLPSGGGGWVGAAEEAVEAGVPWLLLRARGAPPASVEAAGRRLQAACVRRGARLFVRDDVALLERLGAAGLHLPSDAGSSAARRSAAEAALGRPVLLSRACHSLEEVATAAAEEADFIFFSPVFDTISKGMVSPAVGLAGLAAASAAAPGRVVALGGVTPERARACLEAGAVGVASIGGIFGDGAGVSAALARWRAALGGRL